MKNSPEERTEIKYSFLVPAFRATKEQLDRAISPVIDNERSDAEIIIVEAPYNGELVSSAYRDNPKIVCAVSPVASIPVQRNLCLRLARGEYIVFIDADDYVCPDFLSVLDLAVERDADADIIVFQHTGYAFDSPPIGSMRPIRVDRKQQILAFFSSANKRRPHFSEKSLWAKAYKRNAVIESRTFFDNALISTQDHFFNLRLIHFAHKVVFYPECKVYHYEFSNQSITKQLKTSSPERFDLLLSAWEKLNNEFTPSSAEIQNWAFNLVLVYLPSMLNGYFIPLSKESHSKVTEWKQVVKKKPYQRAIRTLHFWSCPNAPRLLLLLAFKLRLYSLIYRLYSHKRLR